MKDHLGVTIGEIVFVLVLCHAELPNAMYLVEKDNGTSKHTQCIILMFIRSTAISCSSKSPPVLEQNTCT